MSRLIRPTTVVSQPRQVADTARVAAAEPQPCFLDRVLPWFMLSIGTASRPAVTPGLVGLAN
jgi:hypothetical protein